MENGKLELQLSLENACFILIAKSLWNQADSRIKIENYFQKNAQLYHTSDEKKDTKLQRDWFDVEDHVLSKVSKICLPGTLRSELELVIILLGDKIRGWFEYVVNILSLDISTAMNIPWTNYDRINKMMNVKFPQENIKIVKNHILCEAVMDIEAEKCSYMQMNEAEQKNNALLIIEKAFNLHQLLNWSPYVPELDYYFEIALKLAINKLSENEMNLFVKTYFCDILGYCLVNYGYQKLFHQVFCNVEKFLTRDDYIGLLVTISRKSRKKAAIDTRQKFVESTFLLLWTEIPLEIKKKLVRNKDVWCFLVNESDTVIWKLIYDDENLEYYRNDMLFYMVFALYSRNSIPLPYSLIKSNFHRNKFKELYVCETIICDGDLYSAEQLAFLLGYSDKEMINFKSELNSSRICNYFIEKDRWNAIDEYLEWRFDSEQEAESFKSRYRTNDFIYKVLCKFWESIDKVTAFLLWLFESEEKIVIYKMENPEIARKLLITLFINLEPKSKNLKLIPYYEAFMKYWLLSSEHMSDLKKYLAKCVD